MMEWGSSRQWPSAPFCRRGSGSSENSDSHGTIVAIEALIHEEVVASETLGLAPWNDDTIDHLEVFCRVRFGPARVLRGRTKDLS